MCAELDTQVLFLAGGSFSLNILLIALSISYSFKIFRLTDPPGLQMIMECQATEEFHPHPEGSIYTVRNPGLFDMMKRSGMMDF